MRPIGALLESVPDARTFFAFDPISEDVVLETEVIPTPVDDARPGQAAEEGTAGPAPSRPRDPPSNDPGKRSQETLKRLAPADAQNEMQV
jgi:hypothetical protein